MMTAKEEIKALEAKLKELKSSIPTTRAMGLTVKVGDKGNLLIYGLNAKFPVSLYLNQAQKLAQLFVSQELQDFIAANADKLSTEKIKV